MRKPVCFTLRVLAALPCLFLGVSLAAQAQESIGVVLAAKGQVEARDASGAVRALSRRSELFEADTIIVGTDGYAQVRMVDDAMIALKANTEFAFNTYDFDGNSATPDSAAMSMLRGGFMTISGTIGDADEDTYHVDTRYASIGIRGTVHSAVIVNDTLITGVYEGGTTISNTEGSIDAGIGADFDFTETQEGEAPQGLVEAPAALSLVDFGTQLAQAEDEDDTEDAAPAANAADGNGSNAQNAAGNGGNDQNAAANGGNAQSAGGNGGNAADGGGNQNAANTPAPAPAPNFAALAVNTAGGNSTGGEVIVVTAPAPQTTTIQEQLANSLAAATSTVTGSSPQEDVNPVLFSRAAVELDGSATSTSTGTTDSSTSSGRDTSTSGTSTSSSGRDTSTSTTDTSTTTASTGRDTSTTTSTTTASTGRDTTTDTSTTTASTGRDTTADASTTTAPTGRDTATVDTSTSTASTGRDTTATNTTTTSTGRDTATTDASTSTASTGRDTSTTTGTTTASTGRDTAATDASTSTASTGRDTTATDASTSTASTGRDTSTNTTTTASTGRDTTTDTSTSVATGRDTSTSTGSGNSGNSSSTTTGTTTTIGSTTTTGTTTTNVNVRTVAAKPHAEQRSSDLLLNPGSLIRDWGVWDTASPLAQSSIQRIIGFFFNSGAEQAMLIPADMADLSGTVSYAGGANFAGTDDTGAALQNVAMSFNVNLAGGPGAISNGQLLVLDGQQGVWSAGFQGDVANASAVMTNVHGTHDANPLAGSIQGLFTGTGALPDFVTGFVLQSGSNSVQGLTILTSD